MKLSSLIDKKRLVSEGSWVDTSSGLELQYGHSNTEFPTHQERSELGIVSGVAPMNMFISSITDELERDVRGQIKETNNRPVRGSKRVGLSEDIRLTKDELEAELSDLYDIVSGIDTEVIGNLADLKKLNKMSSGLEKQVVGVIKALGNKKNIITTEWAQKVAKRLSGDTEELLENLLNLYESAAETIQEYMDSISHVLSEHAVRKPNNKTGKR